MKDVFAQNGVIVSAERVEFTNEENARRSAMLVHKLVDLVGWDGSIIPCTGVFEGVEEQSYIVLVNEDVAGTERARDIMQGILGLSSQFSQEAILVFGQGTARLLELPEIEIVTGDPDYMELGDAIMYLYNVTGGEGMLSDQMHFEEVDHEEIMDFELDYTEVMGRFYTLEA